MEEQVMRYEEVFPPSAGEAPEDGVFAEVNARVTVSGFNTEISTKLLPDHERVISEMKSRYLPLKILGVNDKIGYLAVQEAKRVVKNTRLEVERSRKAAKEQILKDGRDLDNAAKYLTAELEPIEDRLEAEMKTVDAEKDRIKAEAQRKLDERNQGRLSALMEAGKTEIHMADIIMMTDSVFADYLKMAISEQAAAKQAAIDAEVARKAKEEAEALEAARKAKEERERQAAIAEENRKEAVRLAAIRAEQEKVLAAAKADQDARMAAIDAKEAAIAEREAKAAQAEREERIRKDAEAKAKADAERKEQERIAREEREKSEAKARAENEAARLAAIEAAKPDAEKILAFAQTVEALAIPSLTSQSALLLLPEISNGRDRFVAFVRNRAKALTEI